MKRMFQKPEKRRLMIDFGIFVLSVLVLLFAKVEQRYFEMLLLIPSVVFINFCISVYRYYHPNKHGKGANVET